MKKRLLVLLLVVALAVTVSVFTATAETNWSAHVCPVCGGEAREWLPLHKATANDEVLPAGHYYVAGEVTDASKYFQVTGATVCIDLNGNKYARTGQGALFSVKSSAVLNIMDSSAGETGVLQTENSYTSYAGLIQVWNTASCNLYSGTLKYAGTGKYSPKGGTIYVGSGASFTMYDGIIEGGCAKQGGNVYIEGGTFTMKDGIIRNGTVSGDTYSNGGNINNAGGTFIMEDGTISGGDAAWIGGNLRNAGTATITGGEIVNGVARSGGNVVAYSGSFTMSDVTIKNGQVKKGNRSWDCGPNFYHEGGTVTMNDGTVLLMEENHDPVVEPATQDGEDQLNHSAYYGGNLIVSNGVFTMNGGEITGGKGAQGGGSVAVVNPDGNSSKTKDGVVTHYTGQFVLNDGTVSGGWCRYGAGNIEVRLGVTRPGFVMNGGTVSGGVTSSGTTSKKQADEVGVNGVNAAATIVGGTIDGGLDIGPATPTDTTYVDNQNVSVSGTAKITKLVLQDNQRIILDAFQTGAAVKICFGVKADEKTGVIGEIPAGKQVRDFAPYIKCALPDTTYGIGLGKDTDDNLIMGTCDAHINPKDKSLGATTMMNYTDLSLALAEVDAATEMIYLKNVNAGDNADDRRTYADPIVIDKDVVIDMNGVAVNGTFQVDDDKTLTLVDVTADDAASLTNGATNSVVVDGNVATQTQHPRWQTNYIVLVDEQTKVATVHYYSLKISTANIVAEKKGVYFGAELKCDPTLASQIKEFGIHTWLETKNGYEVTNTVGFYTVGTELPTMEDGAYNFNGVLITQVLSGDPGDSDTDNVNRANWEINTKAYVTLKDNETGLESATVAKSMTDVMSLMNQKWESVTGDKSKIVALYNTWAETLGWNFENIQ